MQLRADSLCAEAHGGVSVGVLWFDSALVALVGDADARLLRLYNAQTSRVLCELAFVTPVLSVLMNRRRLLVVLETRLHVYELPHVKLLHTVETALNPRALCVLAAGGSCRVAYPQHGSDDDGSDLAGLKASSPPSSASSAAASGALSAGTVVLFDALALQNVALIRAHKGAIAALAISDSGSLLATASVRGTVIRVFALPAGTVAYALRRGTYAASIRCMAFAHDAPFLCAASQTGTVHVFRLGAPGDSDQYLGNGIEVERASADEQRGRRSPDLLNAPRQITGESPPAPPLISSYLSDMWQAASSVLEPARHFAAVKLAPGVTPIACAFAPLGSRGASVFVMSSDGLFFEFALDVARGGDMIVVRQFSSDENDVVRQPVGAAAAAAQPDLL